MRKQKLYEDKLAEALVEIFKDIRETLGMSQNDVAVRTGLHRSYVGDFERGARTISVKNVSRLAEGLGMPASKLVAKAERRVNQIYGRR